MNYEIIKYNNRKLYSKDASRYVTLKEVADLVKSGFNVRVTKNEDDTDITRDVLIGILKYTDIKSTMLLDLVRRN